MRYSKTDAPLAADMEDFQILSKYYQPHKKGFDTDIPPGHHFDSEKEDATLDPNRGKHKDVKMALANGRAKKDEAM